MKIVLRRGVFETNSSTSHSLTFYKNLSLEDTEKLCEEKHLRRLYSEFDKLCLFVGYFYTAIEDLEWDIEQKNYKNDNDIFEMQRKIEILKKLSSAFEEEYSKKYNIPLDELKKQLLSKTHGGRNALSSLREGPFEWYACLINESNFDTYEKIISLLGLDDKNINYTEVAKECLDENFRVLNKET